MKDGAQNEGVRMKDGAQNGGMGLGLGKGARCAIEMPWW